MSRTILIVMAHREATEVILRHWPLWAAHKVPIMVFAPADSIPRLDPSIPMLLYGRAEHHGVESVRRFKWLLRFLEDYGAAQSFVFEYDSFLLDSARLELALHWQIEFYGGIFQIGEDDPSFAASSYVHPPFGITNHALTEINELDLPDDAERGFWDRWLGLALERARLPCGSYITDHTGFSRNTIEPEDRAAAVKAVEEGAVFFHGVKDPLTLRMIQTAYSKRKESASDPASD